MSNVTRHPASYRDPAGFIFESEGKIYRQVNLAGKEDFELFLQTGLYDQLVKKGSLIPHQNIPTNLTGSENWYASCQPEPLELVSFPWEWSFATLRDAAILTLQIMRASIDKGMILKDATPFNVQFHNGRLVFIDTLSFTRYDASKPWDGYRQFCETFLFPLYLEHYNGIEASRLLSIYPEGISASLTASLLPWKSRWNLGVRLHVLLQRKIRNEKKTEGRSISFSKTKMLHLLQHLEDAVKSLRSGYPEDSVWNHYYDGSILGQDYLNEKTRVISEMINNKTYGTVLDLGANDGHFSKLLSGSVKTVIATDNDRNCIQRLYEEVKAKKISNIYPILLDISNPSPGIGVANKERAAFFDRVRPDLGMALALIHHLAIGKNIPLQQIAAELSAIAPEWIIEFVPKSDEKVKQLLAHRQDIFDEYDQSQFEKFFSTYFKIEQTIPVKGTERILYYMKRKQVC